MSRTGHRPEQESSQTLTGRRRRRRRGKRRKRRRRRRRGRLGQKEERIELEIGTESEREG